MTVPEPPEPPVLDGAHLRLEARQIELLDDTPNFARGVVDVDQALDVEGLESELLAINGDVARSGGAGA